MDQDLGTPIPPLEEPYSPPEKKKNLTIIILVVVLVLLCCCCAIIGLAGGYWLWNNGDNLLGISALPFPFMPM